ncbi:hypothetical protein [Haloplanus halophilus]|uniref:hypothetical protein n=1 Tax=Haloplanus halophilus TaxID=2949993 RepID=UPI002041B50B|nr:hypothetical protein [Haloplanus sp. GDY1]
MRRRAFLSSVGIAALAGCSNGGGSDGTATPTPSPTGSGSPNFELVTVEYAESTPLNNPTSFAIGVENTGTGRGTFTSELDQRLGDGEWETAGELEMPLAAGERGEWHSPRFMPRYLTTFHFRLDAFDRTWSTEAVPAEYDFGIRYATPNDLFVNVLGGSFESAYPTASNETATDGTASNETATDGTASNETATDGTVTPTTPPDGQVWAVMRVDVRNRLQEPQPAPAPSTFTLEVDGEQRPLRQDVTADPYEGGSLGGRTVRRGDLVYPVPAGTEANDLRLTWAWSLEDGDVKVIWTK